MLPHMEKKPTVSVITSTNPTFDQAGHFRDAAIQENMPAYAERARRLGKPKRTRSESTAGEWLNMRALYRMNCSTLCRTNTAATAAIAALGVRGLGGAYSRIGEVRGCITDDDLWRGQRDAAGIVGLKDTTTATRVRPQHLLVMRLLRSRRMHYVVAPQIHGAAHNHAHNHTDHETPGRPCFAKTDRTDGGKEQRHRRDKCRDTRKHRCSGPSVNSSLGEMKLEFEFSVCHTRHPPERQI